jgi:hypothetical protein
MASFTISESHLMTLNRPVFFGLRRQNAAATALSELGGCANIQQPSLKAVSRFACHRSPKWPLDHRSSWKKVAEPGVLQAEKKGAN